MLPVKGFWRLLSIFMSYKGFSDGSDCRESARKSGDPGSIPGMVRFLGEGNGYPLQSSQGTPVVKNPLANAGNVRDSDLIPEFGRSPREGNGNPLQHSCLGNPRDRGAEWPIVHGVTKSQTQVSTHPLQHPCLEKPMDRGSWWTIVHGFTKESDTKRLSNNE